MSTASADAQAAAARVNQEQVFHELEQKYLLLKADFAVVENERDDIVAQKNASAEQMKKLQTTVDEREAELAKTKDELLKLRSERDQLSFQVRAATSQAERRLNDVEELQQTVKDQNKQLMESQRREVEALQKVAEQDAIVEPLRHQISRLEAELDATKQHLEWTEKQLTAKTSMVQDMRQASTKMTHDHEELKTRHAEELGSLRKQLESARQANKKLDSSLVQSKEHVKEVQAARMHEQERLHNELNAQRRLADLYKDSAEDANTRINELQELCEKLRQSLAESEDALSHQEERTKQQVEHIFREQAAASERRIEVLQDELKVTQDKLEELQKNKLVSLQTASTVSGLSSAAGVAHLAANGVTPKELCDQILALETALRSERDEKEQLQISLNRVVDEVRVKAPMIIGLKQDLQQATATNVKQSDQLQACMQDLVKCRAREQHLAQEKKQYERKCEALAKSVDDLSRQVQHLLFRAHESSAAESSSGGAGESASENLVVFKDVEELQIRNQQLLMVIREMTEAQKKPSAHLIGSGESDEESDSDIGSSSRGKRFEAAMEEIEKLRSEREEEKQMISAIVQQRDMYRVLLAQADSKFSESANRPSVSAGASESSSTAQHHRPASIDLAESRAIRELQKDFEVYKKEKQLSMKALQEELDRARSESSAFRLSQMQAQVEAKCNKDRYEAAEKRRQDADEEVLRVRTRSDQITNLLVQHQKMLSETEAKFNEAATQLRALEVEKEGALRELTFMKKNEAKMLQELATMRLDNTNLLKLMETNRQLDSSREERERRESDRMTQKISVLENKLQETYDKLESNEAVAGAKIAAEEQARKIATAELSEAKEQIAKAREQLARLEEQLTAATTKCSLHEKEVTHLREQLRKGASTAAAERVSALEVQLRQSQLETQSAVEMKKSLMEAVSKYKAIAEANEKSLTELSAASESWKTEHEKKLAALQVERDTLRGELDKARSQIKDDVSEGNKLREEMDKMVVSHQTTLQHSREHQQKLQVEADAARAELSALQQEVSTLREDVATAQENYERELKLHASQVEKYSSTRKQVQEEQNKNRALLSEVSELKARVAVAEKEAAENIASIEKLLMDANHSKSSLSEQNKLLHSQLERANNDLRRAHEAQLLQNVGTGSATAGGQGNREFTKEMDDLRSVIAYLRKENEISSSKFELSHQENERFKAQVRALESTIERLRDELKNAENSSSVVSARSIETATKSAAQLEQLDLLRESNATLRKECQRNIALVRIEEERVKNLEAQLGPLRNSESLLKAQIDSLKQEMTTLSDANTRWKQRVDQLVEKYQQVDPAEYEKVCQEKVALEKELAEQQAKENALKNELETLKSSEGKNAEEEKSKTENLRKQYDRIKGFAKTWKTKAEGLTKQVAEKSKEAEDKASLVVELQKKLAQSLSEKTALESKLSSQETAKSDDGSASAAWEKERQELKDKVEVETKRYAQLKEINTKVMSGLKALRQENSQLKEQVAQVATVQQVAEAQVSQENTPSASPKAPVAPDSEALAPTPVVTAAGNAKPSATLTTTGNSKPPATVTAAGTAKPSSTMIEAVAPAKSPMLAAVPAPTPVMVPTLKTVGGGGNGASMTPLNPAAKPFVASSVVAASPAKVPAQAEAKVPTPADPTTNVASAKNTNTPQLSEEEKLRLTLQQSMMKKFKKPVQDGGAKLTAPTPTLTKPVATPAAAAKPPLLSQAPPLPPAAPMEESKPVASLSAKPIAALAPVTTAFGATTFGTGTVFGAGGAGGLVFGKPGITLPVPASPTPTPILAAVTAAPAASSLFTTPVNTTAQPQTTENGPAGAVGTETEAQRRSQRLARFAATEAEPSSTVATLKRPATTDPDTTTPQKVPKLNQQPVANAGATEDSQATEDEQIGDDSEATEDEASAAPSPPGETE